MVKKLPELNLPSADELFTTQEERDDLKREKVLDIPLSEIDPFPEHPFQVISFSALYSLIHTALPDISPKKLV